VFSIIFTTIADGLKNTLDSINRNDAHIFPARDFQYPVENECRHWRPFPELKIGECIDYRKMQRPLDTCPSFAR